MITYDFPAHTVSTEFLLTMNKHIKLEFGPFFLQARFLSLKKRAIGLDARFRELGSDEAAYAKRILKSCVYDSVVLGTLK